MKVDMNEIYADLQDYYIRMTPKQLKVEFRKGAGNIWKNIYDDETQKILLQKVFECKED